MTVSSGTSDIYDVLEDHYDLRNYGIDWRDGERTLHEMWRIHPQRRFNSYAIMSLYMFAADFCPKGANVLDLGCATGFGSYHFAAKTKARSLLGVDLDESSISWGKQRFARENLELRCANLHDPGLDKYLGKLDFIYCSNVMEHVEDYKEVLHRIHALLKPGALYFHVTPPSGNSGGNPYHITNFKIPHWCQLLIDVGFHGQRYFAQQNDVERDRVSSEFDFSYTECGPEDMLPSSGLGSISGIILARKSFNPNPKAFEVQATVDSNA